MSGHYNINKNITKNMETPLLRGSLTTLRISNQAANEGKTKQYHTGKPQEFNGQKPHTEHTSSQGSRSKNWQK